ncbi:MAG: DUF1573 domain-containing protein [Planctomycetes bacterium]|nr:DUF1573 domain-containing protein [Planctomycetota bacterium]
MKIAFLLVGVLAVLGSAESAALPAFSEHVSYRTTLSVTNPYDRAIKVESIDSTCTCTELSLPERLLLPRETVAMAMEADNRNRSGRQEYGITLFLSDPALEPIELKAQWVVIPDIQVDLIAPGADSQQRPAEVGFRDVYRYVAKARPDELHRLRKRIRLSCPDGAAPPGGLQVSGTEYTGRLWRFTATVQADASILVVAEARDPEMADPPLGLLEEQAVILTNHPHKPRIELVFTAYINKDAGQTIIDPGALRPGPDGGLPEQGVVGSDK